MQNHPDFRLESDGNARIVRAARIYLIEQFPAQGGFYMADPQFGIPFGDVRRVSSSGTQALKRLEKRIGRVARGCYGYFRRDVDLGNWPSSVLGVAVDAHEAKD